MSIPYISTSVCPPGVSKWMIDLCILLASLHLLGGVVSAINVIFLNIFKYINELVYFFH